MKNIAVLLIISVFWISYRTTQYFEDKLNSNQTKVHGATQEKRFFLPLPKDYEEISKMLNIVALSIMISCLNKDYIDMVESLIIKRSLRGIESPDRDAIVGTDYKKIEDIKNKYSILNNLN